MEKRRKAIKRLKKGLDAVHRTVRKEASIGRYLHLGVTFALSALLFFFVGYRLDLWLGTLPVFTLVGTFLGGTGGFIYLYQDLTAGDREKAAGKRRNKRSGS